MISYEGMKSEASGQGYAMLPEGPYIAKITAVKIDGAAPNQSLVIRTEITEGDYKDYFTKRFQAESAQEGRTFPPKYKGDFRLRIPHPQSSSQWPESDKRKLNDAIYRIENSNPGYHWDGDENKLVGKAVGINMQLGTFNDREYTQIGRFEIVEDIRKGLIKTMKPKKPAYSSDYGQQAAPAVPAGFTPAEEEIPF